MITSVEMIERENAIIVDGISSSKTVKEAVADFERYIREHIDKNDSIINEEEFSFYLVCKPSKERE